MCPAGVMVPCMRLGSVVRASGRALSTATGRQQRRALAADTAGEDSVICDIDQDQVTRKSFAEIQREREEQAKHSVLINCPSKIRESTFLKHLSRHGEVANHFFFESIGTHAVVEFANTESIDSLLTATRIPDEDVYVVPFKTRLIKIKSKEMDLASNNSPKPSVSITGLLNKLCAANSIADQANILIEEHQLTEESIRLRYLVSSLVSDLATAYFPEATVHLYGSSVNSFGKTGCDLDLFLNLNSIKDMSGRAAGSFVTEYLMKRAPSSRVAQQKILSVIAECLDSFGPGCTGVHKILNARCPLVRFYHHPAGLHCDLTADNRIALRSSELLYIYGNIDSRVRPLIFALRCWANVHGITKSVSGHWITNFSLTAMVLFFLQKRNPPVIPTLDELQNLADKNDKCIVEDNDCTFVSDLSKIKPSANTEPLDELLVGFLEFYGSFDFSKNCIDIRKGVERNKPDSFPLYIQNPFEQSLNISKNVNKSQLERFVQLVQESCWTLQEQASQPLQSGEKETWGLASILLSSVSEGAPSSKKSLASQRLGSLIDSLKANNNSKRTTDKKKAEKR
ncbi:PREDICTED: poly(A) RNA polymerase, mitochondrial [Nanorana parkeri]|uniref:poly(A) RNA polymerase, mitochondrial n=1 Tax=Nanorana parkeri TaxID=125878 RepID=UPI0008546A29|nr:PREDICTED: poly(A) RNA polymerase, mitochondrial [Nanorana parkeri]